MHREGQDTLEMGWDDKLGLGGWTSLEEVMGTDKGRGGRDGIGKQFVSTLVEHCRGALTSHRSDQPSAV